MMVSSSFSVRTPLINGDTLHPHTDARYRIGITASGSRGDVQPYIALGLYLQSRGHDVIIATEKRLQPLVEEFELKYRLLEGDPAGVLYLPEAQGPLKSGSLWKLMSLTKEWEKQWNKMDIYQSYVTALAGCDVVIASPLTMTPSYCVAEYMNALWIPMILGPTLPSSEFPVWPLESLIFCQCLNKWSYNFLYSMLWSSEKELINKWRKESLKLHEIRNNRGIMDIVDALKSPIIISYSRYLCPHQRIPGDYPPHAHLHGFIFAPDTNDSAIDLKVKEFLNHDKRPVIYLGFGSMPAPDVDELINMCVDICSLSNCRGILVAGWSQLFDDNGMIKNSRLKEACDGNAMIAVKSISHNWLFPKVDCIIHHGGIGTTAAGLLSGKPQVICPVMLDQPHNAKAVIALSCAPGYVEFNNTITAAKVANLVKQVLPHPDESENKYIASARQVGEMIRQESSTALSNYANIIETYIANQLAAAL